MKLCSDPSFCDIQDGEAPACWAGVFPSGSTEQSSLRDWNAYDEGKKA